MSVEIYLFTPSSHVAHGGLHPNNPGPPGRNNVRNSITSPAVHPPRIAVTIAYIRSLAAAVMARSAPPGIADILITRSLETC